MKTEHKITLLKRGLRQCKLDHLTIVTDQIKGNRFAIAEEKENSLDIKTDFMTFIELDSYIMGYYTAIINKFKR